MSSLNTTSPDNSTAVAGPECSNVVNQVDMFGLRVGSLFIIMVTSMCASLFPVLTRRTSLIRVPHDLFELAKYFGSGVIIATAFIHLLSPAITALSSPCLTGAWTQYPWPLGISMASVFAIFFVELIAFRWGTAKLASIGITAKGTRYHSHGPFNPEEAKHQEGERKATDGMLEQGVNVLEANHQEGERKATDGMLEQGVNVLDEAVAQVVGIFILEFGILFHSVLIGLTLAVDPNFKILFVVLVFHQMFEGLGLGARLAFMKLPPNYNWVPILGALLYGLTTPIGIAAGLGIRSTYNPGSTTASIVSGCFDSISSGILLYTGLVELLAHEFLFNPAMHRASNKRLAFASISMVSGAALMALLGRWA